MQKMIMNCFNQISQSAGYKADDVAATLTVCGGSYGGGSETLVVGRTGDTDDAELVYRKRTVSTVKVI